MRAFTLNEDPFPSVRDRDFYFSTPALSARLDELSEAVALGHVLLIDEAGSGKSTMLASFAECASERSRVFHLQARANQCAKEVAHDLVSKFGLPLREPIAAALRDADTLLELLTTRSQNAVIVIDDAHLLEDGALEQLLYLAKRWERVEVRFLVSAEPVLLEKLASLPGDLHFPGAVTTLAMPRFDDEQVSDYLQLCLYRAGLTGDSPFDPSVVAKVTEQTRGLVGAIDPIAKALLDEGAGDGARHRPAESAHLGRRWPVALVAAAGLGALLAVALPAVPESEDTAQSHRQSREFRSSIIPGSRKFAAGRREQSAAAPP